MQYSRLLEVGRLVLRFFGLIVCLGFLYYLVKIIIYRNNITNLPIQENGMIFLIALIFLSCLSFIDWYLNPLYDYRKKNRDDLGFFSFLRYF